MGRRRLARSAWNWLATEAAAVWQGIREASGDAAYENYLRTARQRGPQSHPASLSPCGTSPSPLSRRDFYLESVRRRYSGISRCC